MDTLWSHTTTPPPPPPPHGIRHTAHNHTATRPHDAPCKVHGGPPRRRELVRRRLWKDGGMDTASMPRNGSAVLCWSPHPWHSIWQQSTHTIAHTANTTAREVTHPPQPPIVTTTTAPPDAHHHQTHTTTRRTPPPDAHHETAVRHTELLTSPCNMADNAASWAPHEATSMVKGGTAGVHATSVAASTCNGEADRLPRLRLVVRSLFVALVLPARGGLPLTCAGPTALRMATRPS